MSTEGKYLVCRGESQGAPQPWVQGEWLMGWGLGFDSWVGVWNWGWFLGGGGRVEGLKFGVC